MCVSKTSSIKRKADAKMSFEVCEFLWLLLIIIRTFGVVLFVGNTSLISKGAGSTPVRPPNGFKRYDVFHL